MSTPDALIPTIVPLASLKIIAAQSGVLVWFKATEPNAAAENGYVLATLCTY